MKALSFLIFLASLLVLGSCQKDSSSNETPKTKTQLITSSAWKYDKAQLDLDNNGTGDQPLPASFIENCQTDNTITFTTNGSGIVDEGATKCDAGDPQTIPFTWSLTNNETTINFSSAVFAGLGGDFKVVSISESQLVISRQMAIPPSPIAVSIIATFKH